MISPGSPFENWTSYAPFSRPSFGFETDEAGYCYRPCQLKQGKKERNQITGTGDRLYLGALLIGDSGLTREFVEGTVLVVVCFVVGVFGSPLAFILFCTADPEPPTLILRLRFTPHK